MFTRGYKTTNLPNSIPPLSTPTVRIRPMGMARPAPYIGDRPVGVLGNLSPHDVTTALQQHIPESSAYTLHVESRRRSTSTSEIIAYRLHLLDRSAIDSLATSMSWLARHQIEGAIRTAPQHICVDQRAMSIPVVVSAPTVWLDNEAVRSSIDDAFQQSGYTYAQQSGPTWTSWVGTHQLRGSDQHWAQRIDMDRDDSHFISGALRYIVNLQTPSRLRTFYLNWTGDRGPMPPQLISAVESDPLLACAHPNVVRARDGLRVAGLVGLGGGLLISLGAIGLPLLLPATPLLQPLFYGGLAALGMSVATGAHVNAQYVRYKAQDSDIQHLLDTHTNIVLSRNEVPFAWIRRDEIYGTWLTGNAPDFVADTRVGPTTFAPALNPSTS